MNLQDQYLSLRTLTVFAGIRKDAVITALESLLTADPAAATARSRQHCMNGIPTGRAICMRSSWKMTISVCVRPP